MMCGRDRSRDHKMDVGSHCSFSPCKRLDFLPFECEGCKKIFCSYHRTTDSHHCIPVTSSINTKTHDEVSKKPEQTVHCSIPHCHSIGDVVCKDCGNVYCLNHRNPAKHDCSSLAIKPKVQSTHVPSSSHHRRPQGPASAALSAKVALMRLKQKALPLGSTGIPESEKIFYQVILPTEYGEKNYPVYLSKEWSVGKIVDCLSVKFKLRNNNDQAGAKKLVLLNSDREKLSMSAKIDDLLEIECPNGAFVHLEYQD